MDRKCIDPRSKCHHHDCDNLAIFCFLMRGFSLIDGLSSNWRKDLCEQHSREFRNNPPIDYEHVESPIYYEENR
jgi:hypothetical protein